MVTLPEDRDLSECPSSICCSSEYILDDFHCDPDVAKQHEKILQSDGGERWEVRELEYFPSPKLDDTRI